MSQTRTSKCPYQSKYGGGWISAGQYLAEYMSERLAKKDGRELPEKFWNIADWKKFFLYQITLGNKLLKKYTLAEVLVAMNAKECQYAYSLKIKALDRILAVNRKKEAALVKSVVSSFDEEVKKDDIFKEIKEKPRTPFIGKRNILWEESQA